MGADKCMEQEDILFEAQNLSILLEGREVIKEVSLAVYKGECIGIIGPNGTGKSTLLKGLRGLLPWHSGKVLWNDKVIKTMSEKELARRMAYMQQSVALSFEYTVEEIVLTARYPYLKWWQNETIADKKIAEQAMKDTGIWKLRDKPISAISGGERQRVFLAKALAQEAELLLLDEPTAALDMGYADDMFYDCQKLTQTGKTVIAVIHDLELAAKYCHRLILLHNGHILADGTPKEVLTAAHLKQSFMMDSCVYDDPFFSQLRIWVRPKAEREKEEKTMVGET